jgi:phenylalanyl-tRNA synthetase alpha chain
MSIITHFFCKFAERKKLIIAMLEKINELKAQIEGLTASNAADVEALRIKYLSKKGEVSLLFNDFRNVPADQKKAMGQALNELKNLANDKINANASPIIKQSLKTKSDFFRISILYHITLQ